MAGDVPDIPGVKAEYQLAKQFQIEVAELLKRHNLGFPGAQPVSFAARHIEELKREE
jgi:mRNA guanylyltransferase